MNINSLTSSFKSFFELQNTTTAANDLSKNLIVRVQIIFKGTAGNHEKIPVPTSALPAVFIQADTTNVEPYQVGRTNKRVFNVKHKVVGVTGYGMSTGDSGQGRENADMEALQLASNIETIIHNNYTMSNTVQWILVDGSTYDSNISDNAYNSVVEISLKSRLTS